MTFTNLLTFYFSDKEVQKGFSKGNDGWSLYIERLGVPYRVDLLRPKCCRKDALEECAEIIITSIIREGFDSLNDKMKHLQPK